MFQDLGQCRGAQTGGIKLEFGGVEVPLSRKITVN